MSRHFLRFHPVYSVGVLLIVGNMVSFVGMGALLQARLLGMLIIVRLARLLFILIVARWYPRNLPTLLMFLALVLSDGIALYLQQILPYSAQEQGSLFLSLTLVDAQGSSPIPGLSVRGQWVVMVIYNCVSGLIMYLGFSLKAQAYGRKVLESGRQLLNDLIGALPIGIALYHKPDHLLFINQAGYTFMRPEGAPEQPISPKLLSNRAGAAYAGYQQVYQKDSYWQAQVAALWHGARRSDKDIFTTLTHNRQGQKVLQASSRLIQMTIDGQYADPSKEQTCLLTITTDVSEQERMMNELETAKEEAERSNAAKSIFLANVSHELRTPLTSVVGFSQLIASRQDSPLEVRELAQIITRSGESLLALVNDVLDLSKAEANRLRLVETMQSPRRVLVEESQLIATTMADKGLELHLDIADDVPERVCMDETKVRQLLRNLLFNAYQFTKKGGIKVRLWSTGGAQKPQTLLATTELPIVLHLEVQDTGVGIAEDELSHLFEPFMQTYSGLASRQGTGLGLAVSKQFAQCMGGDLRVTSRLGVGSTFACWLVVKRGCNGGDAVADTST